MKIDYFFAERRFNSYFEEITIKGYSPVVKLDFISIITRMNKLSELVEDINENYIVVQSGDWFYKIETTLCVENVKGQQSIEFDYTKYKLSPQVYIAFIGSIVTQL